MKQTQEDKVLEYIKENGSITTLEAFNDLGVTRLSDRIFCLRNKGIDIKTTRKSVKNRYGSRVSIAIYTLDKEKVNGN